MKKFLIPILTVIILLTGCNHTNTGQEPSTSYSDPPPTIIIRNKETLENIQDILTGDDMTEDEFGEYVAYTLYAVIGNGITKQDFICLFELFEAMSVPVSEDLKLSGIYYIPPDNDLSVFFKSNSEEMYTFTFHIDRPTVEQYIQKEMGKKPTSIYQKENARVKVYNTIEKDDLDTHQISFLMDIDGYFVRAGYRNNEKDVSKMKPDELFKDFSLTYLKDIPWAD
ncbi:MAG: hypothetical protein DBY29_14630 [Coprobacillus sp.]|nr:MAG: hypothetical protein DBY29_14630 [Coprobacillus sp.]